MHDMLKTLVGSSLLAAAISGFVSWQVANLTIDRELQSRQVEAGYDALVTANAKKWQAEQLEKQAGSDHALLDQVRLAKREAEAGYTAARQKIAAFGDAQVVTAMANYFRHTPNGIARCEDQARTAADTRIYKTIRDTLGAGGHVSVNDLATVMFLCRLD